MLGKARQLIRYLRRRRRRPDALALLALVTPREPVGVAKIRVGNAGRDGRRGDGGYVMADDFDGIAAAVSVGIGGDASWDRDVAARGIAVHQFDHTIERPPLSHPLFVFNRIGVAAADSADGVLRSLDSLVEYLGIAGDLVLKIDCEGAEWAVFDAAAPRTLRRFAQIAVEIHDPLNLAPHFDGSDRNLDILRKLARTHQIIHVHANSCDRVDDVGGIEVPAVIELTYLRRDRARFIESGQPLPGPLDVSNSAGPDIPIGSLLAQR
jgi:hypothetical protein